MVKYSAVGRLLLLRFYRFFSHFLLLVGGFFFLFRSACNWERFRHFQWQNTCFASEEFQFSTWTNSLGGIKISSCVEAYRRNCLERERSDRERERDGIRCGKVVVKCSSGLTCIEVREKNSLVSVNIYRLKNYVYRIWIRWGKTYEENLWILATLLKTFFSLSLSLHNFHIIITSAINWLTDIHEQIFYQNIKYHD